MTVKFSPAERGTKTIGGTFKLSVCSAQSCLLEQRQLTARVLTSEGVAVGMLPWSS